MRKVIVNSTPIIALANMDKLQILRDMYQEILIPEAVYHELTVKDELSATGCALQIGFK